MISIEKLSAIHVRDFMHPDANTCPSCGRKNALLQFYDSVCRGCNWCLPRSQRLVMTGCRHHGIVKCAACKHVGVRTADRWYLYLHAVWMLRFLQTELTS